jgi:hypothetical protein
MVKLKNPLVCPGTVQLSNISTVYVPAVKLVAVYAVTGPAGGIKPVVVNSETE